MRRLVVLAAILSVACGSRGSGTPANSPEPEPARVETAQPGSGPAEPAVGDPATGHEATTSSEPKSEPLRVFGSGVLPERWPVTERRPLRLPSSPRKVKHRPLARAPEGDTTMFVDGRTAYVFHQRSGRTPERWELLRWPDFGAPPERIAEGTGSATYACTSLSPVTERAAFVLHRDDQRGVVTIDLQTGAMTDLFGFVPGSEGFSSCESAWSPDGRYLATSGSTEPDGQGQVRVHDTQTGTEVARLDGISADVVDWTDCGIIVEWSTEVGELQWDYTHSCWAWADAPPQPFERVVPSPDGRFAVQRSERGLEICPQDPGPCLLLPAARGFGGTGIGRFDVRWISDQRVMVNGEELTPWLVELDRGRATKVRSLDWWWDLLPSSSKWMLEDEDGSLVVVSIPQPEE